MIIKGKSRAEPGALAAHLGNAEKNERVALVETKGTMSQDLRGALVEMDALAVGTRCEKSLYHAAISPEPPHRLSPEQRQEAVDALEKNLGLEGHSRVVVLHEKEGREHVHVVWSRIDVSTMRAISDSHNYRKHEEVARDLERRFGHERVQGAHHERDGVQRPDRTPSRAELRQEERTGIKGKDVRHEVTEAFRASDTPDAFKAALEDKGYILAQGDRRDFVVVDRAGGIHSLARRIEDVKAAELREFMKSISRDDLPSVAVARDTQIDLNKGDRSRLDHLKWDDALALSAIQKAKTSDNRDEERKRELRESRAKAKLARSYDRNQDYMSQTLTAQKHHRRRQREFDKIPRLERPIIADSFSTYEKLKSLRAAEDNPNAKPLRSAYERMKENLKGVEITDQRAKKLDRLSEKDSGVADDRPLDRQPEAPGGGRTRSR